QIYTMRDDQATRRTALIPRYPRVVRQSQERVPPQVDPEPRRYLRDAPLPLMTQLVGDDLGDGRDRPHPVPRVRVDRDEGQDQEDDEPAVEHMACPPRQSLRRERILF